MRGIAFREKMMYSFTDTKGKRFIACSECERGGNGIAKDKCACGWDTYTNNGLGCYSGEEIAREIQVKKFTKAQERYRRYLKCSDIFENFISFCKYEDTQNSKLI